MINLKVLVLQMKEKDYTSLLLQLKENSADKFHTLLFHLRETPFTDEQIIEKLGINQGAYYTLKSRLNQKIQEHLSANLLGSKVDLLQSVANIPNLLFNTPRRTALAVLNKLEKDLINSDMPYELAGVYNALKKLYRHSPKYYDYTQLYNKHIAYTIALDKSDDLLASFNKLLSEYYGSRNSASLELLWLVKKEMASVCRLYKSHHLAIGQFVLNVSFALFVPLSEAIEEDDPVEDMLTEMQKILKSYPNDITYQYAIYLHYFLSFEYYHKLKLYKKETEYFNLINENLSGFMLYNFCSFNSKFLLSKLERYIRLNKEAELYQENEQLLSGYEPDISDAPNYINYVKYIAVSAFYSEKYNEAIKLLEELFSNISFKTFPHADVEIKLLLALCYSMVNKYETAYGLLRSVSRKIKELQDTLDYENATIFSKMLNVQMSSSSQDKEKKLLNLRNKFELLNQGNCRMLEYLNLNDNFIINLAKAVK